MLQVIILCVSVEKGNEKVKALVTLTVVSVPVPWAEVSLLGSRFPSGYFFPSDLFVTGG